ncbi:unnamed protein product, partial [Mesorhabditis spiculigera]
MDAALQSNLTTIFCSAGIILNSFLLYLIVTDREKNCGGYRNLLAIIAVYNIYYSLMKTTVDVAFLIDDAGYLLFSKRLCHYGYWPAQFSAIFNRWYNLFCLVLVYFLATAFNGVAGHIYTKPSPERTALSRRELLHGYNVSIDGLGYLGPVYKVVNPLTGEVEHRWANFLGNSTICVLMIAIYLIVCNFAFKLYAFVRSSVLSEKRRALNMQLLKLLVIQAICPLIFEYIPALTTMWGGFLCGFAGISLSRIAPMLPIFISIYAPADAIMVIFGFRAYRRRVLRYFGVVPSQTSSLNMSSDKRQISAELQHKPKGQSV